MLKRISTETTDEKNEFYAEEIKRLKKEMNAVLLVHYYQQPKIQALADYLGDSLQLSQEAAKTDADVIVFAGVHFMAETAKILNPKKLVLLPDVNAGCSLAEGCPAPLLQKFKDKYPGHILITYINSSVEVKSISDIIVTSSNAAKIVRQIPEDKKIIFAPDKNLGKYVMKKTGRDMVLWQGACIVHETFSEKKILRLKLEHPEAKLIAHPECEEIILDKADFIGSTSALLKYTKENSAKEFIVATEPGIITEMKKESPDKIFIEAPPEAGCSCNECEYMKMNSLKKIYNSLKFGWPTVEVAPEIAQDAVKPIEKMLSLS